MLIATHRSLSVPPPTPLRLFNGFWSKKRRSGVGAGTERAVSEASASRYDAGQADIPVPQAFNQQQSVKKQKKLPTNKKNYYLCSCIKTYTRQGKQHIIDTI